MTGSGRSAIRDNPYVRQVSRQHPRNEIARKVSRWCARNLKLSPGALEEPLQVWNAAMVNVRVWFAQPPAFGVAAKVCPHVLMNQGLQVDTNRPVGANDDIRAYTSICGNVAHRIGDTHIGAVVNDGGACLVARRAHQFERVRSGYRSQNSRCQIERQRHQNQYRQHTEASGTCSLATRRVVWLGSEPLAVARVAKELCLSSAPRLHCSFCVGRYCRTSSAPEVLLPRLSHPAKKLRRDHERDHHGTNDENLILHAV